MNVNFSTTKQKRYNLLYRVLLRVLSNRCFTENLLIQTTPLCSDTLAQADFVELSGEMDLSELSGDVLVVVLCSRCLLVEVP